MLPLRSYYGLGRDEDEEMAIYGGDSSLSSRSTAGTKAVKSHSEAERKRRQRINGHLATLRTLLPSTTIKMDKATLLGEVVRHVRELREMADDVAFVGGEGVVVPGEGDEVRVVEEEEEEGRVKAWVCCADRPGLMGELNRAVRSVRARPVRAEMATLGGRTKSVLELVEVQGEEGRSALQAALRVVQMAKEPGSMGLVAENKKRRLSLAAFNSLLV